MSEMSELTLTIIRLGFLAVLWMFVLTAVSVMRSDLFGRRVAGRSSSRRPARTSLAASRPNTRQCPVSHDFIEAMPSIRYSSRRSDERTTSVRTAESRLMAVHPDAMNSRVSSSPRSAGSRSDGSSSASWPRTDAHDDTADHLPSIHTRSNVWANNSQAQ